MTTLAWLWLALNVIRLLTVGSERKWGTRWSDYDWFGPKVYMRWTCNVVAFVLVLMVIA